MNAIASHPVLALVLSQLLGAALVFGAILVLFPLHRKAVLDPVKAFCHRWRLRMTAAGDDPACACDTFSRNVYCLACHRVRLLTTSGTLSPAESARILDGELEVLRRRAAFEKYDELELDEVAVN